MKSGSKTPASRPGAMSLLDKYSSINASIEDARRRVAEVRSKLERTDEKIISLREERNGMMAEAERASSDQMRLSTELKEAKNAYRAKLAEMEGARRDHRIAKSEYDSARRRIDEERIAFMQRCREFRSTIKKLRAESTIFVLDGGGVANDEVDPWRRLLQDEEFSNDEYDDSNDNGEEQEGGSNSNKDPGSSDTRKRKRDDSEVEQAERDEKESREALIEVECALHDERKKIDEAAMRSNARNSRLTQQRAQLQRHRKEVEEMEREVRVVKDEIVNENHLANTYEKGEGVTLLRCIVVPDSLLPLIERSAIFFKNSTGESNRVEFLPSTIALTTRPGHRRLATILLCPRPRRPTDANNVWSLTPTSKRMGLQNTPPLMFQTTTREDRTTLERITTPGRWLRMKRCRMPPT